MRGLYKAILTSFLIFTLALGTLSIAAFGIYKLYLRPVSANFEFARDESTLASIEIVDIKKGADDKFEFTTAKAITDKESFLKDFTALSATKGFSPHALLGFPKIDGLQAIKFTYADESFEIITPYGNIDSAIFTPDIDIKTLINREYYMFDKTAFDSLISKYSAE